VIGPDALNHPGDIAIRSGDDDGFRPLFEVDQPVSQSRQPTTREVGCFLFRPEHAIEVRADAAVDLDEIGVF
jgi:hypothetical protein